MARVLHGARKFSALFKARSELIEALAEQLKPGKELRERVNVLIQSS